MFNYSSMERFRGGGTGGVGVVGVVLALVVMAAVAAPVMAAEVAVVYPVVREPYSRVYSDIISGIASRYAGKVKTYTVNGDLASLHQSLIGKRGEQPEAVIALGSKSLKAVQALNIKAPVYAALAQKPATGNHSAGGIVLKPGADSYLSALIGIDPDVETVHVVYTPARHQGLIDDARHILSASGRKLDAVPVANIRESARGLRDIVKRSRPGDAIWLISDTGLIDASLLDMVLDFAWDKRLAVFSSNPVFVKRGALFAIYPDNRGVGVRLAELASGEAVSGSSGDGYEHLTSIHVAYNERTGKHIGVRLSSEYRETINLILPEQ